MMNSWSPESEPNQKQMLKPEPISLFLRAINKDPKFYCDMVYTRMLHCLTCGLPVATLTNSVVYATDNEGLPLEDLTGYGYIEVRCKRCKQPYRIFV